MIKSVKSCWHVVGITVRRNVMKENVVPVKLRFLRGVIVENSKKIYLVVVNNSHVP